MEETLVSKSLRTPHMVYEKNVSHQPEALPRANRGYPRQQHCMQY